MENEKLQISRHSLSHILAKAVCELYPNTKLAIGPAISDGFYYDFDLTTTLNDEDLRKIENKMREIIMKKEPFVRKVVSRKEAQELFKNQPYKLELINELPDNEEISVYYLGEDFYDLCRGPHVENSINLANMGVYLRSVSGAYFKGDEKRPMLQRIYAYAFENSKELKAYMNQIEEAQKRDHNKLGRSLELFTTVDYIGQGLPIMLPKGAKMLQILQRFVEDEEQRRGWLLTKTPFMAKSDLYKISGHWDHYLDGMFVLGDPTNEKEEVLALRPMTCPFQYQCYLNRPRSYKDLPLRYDETSTLFRNEASGEMHGLIRVRQFTLSEGHLMCTPEQLEAEFKSCLELAIFMLKTLGLYEDASYRFSQWDPNNREKYIGTEEQWNEAQSTMKKILEHLNIPYFVGVGEAAFYGPKLDIQIKNVWGKEDTLITIQIDQMLAEKFGMYYTDKDGVKKNPYIIHRSSIGCYERTLAYLIEKYAGNFPFWLAPEQIGIASVAEAHIDYAKQIEEKLNAYNFRLVPNYDNETLGSKIKEFRLAKLPYAILIGDKEIETNSISVRTRSGKQLQNIKLDDFVNICLKQNANKQIELIEEI